MILLALLQKAASHIKGIIAFASREFFLIFVYCIIGSIMALVVWLLLSRVFTNKDLYTRLVAELNGSEKLTVAFIFVTCLGCIYLFRLLQAALQGSVLK